MSDQESPYADFERRMDLVEQATRDVEDARQRANPNYNELALMAQHGMSRAEWEAREAALAADAAETRILSMVEGPIPADVVVKHKLPPARLELASYVAYRDRLEAELAALETDKGSLTGLTEAPSRTASCISDLIKRSARALLGRADVGEAEVAKRQALDVQLSAETHRAQVAAAAIAELDQKSTRGASRSKDCVREKASGPSLPWPSMPHRCGHSTWSKSRP